MSTQDAQGEFTTGFLPDPGIFNNFNSDSDSDFWGNVGNFILDVGRARLIDVERGDEDRNVQDYTDTNVVGQRTGSESLQGVNVKTIGLIVLGVAGLLLVFKKVL